LIEVGGGPGDNWRGPYRKGVRDHRRRGLGREHGGSPPAREDHAHLPADQIGRQCRQSVVVTFRPAVFDRHILAFDIARFLQTLVERRDLLAQRSGRCGIEEAGHRHRRLLRTRRERPSDRRAADYQDELAPFHCTVPPVLTQKYHRTSALRDFNWAVAAWGQKEAFWKWPAVRRRPRLDR